MGKLRFLSVLAILFVAALVFRSSEVNALAHQPAPPENMLNTVQPDGSISTNKNPQASKDVASAAFYPDGTVVTSSTTTKAAMETTEAWFSWESQGRFGSKTICVENNTQAPWLDGVMPYAETSWDRTDNLIMVATGLNGCNISASQTIPVGTYLDAGGACAVAYKYGVSDDIINSSSMWFNRDGSVQPACGNGDFFRKVKIASRAMGYILGLRDDGDPYSVMTYGNWSTYVPSIYPDLCHVEVRYPWDAAPNCS